MELALSIVALVAVSVAGAALARKLNLAEPLFLIVVGVVCSLLPFVGDVSLDPDVVLVGLLPPLLYATAIRTSLIDLRAEAVGVALLSIGLVVFTTVAVGLVVWWLLPVPLAVGFALGAVVAPPDAVAASAIANRVGMPRRVVTLLEGESLLNDATALVALHAAIDAIDEEVTAGSIFESFVLAAGGGVAVGVAVAYVLGKFRRRILDPVFDTAVSFLAPFAAYVLAEEIHGSGVVAAVVAGLVFGQRAYVWQRASSRLAERINWRSIQFILEATVFVLIGLQTRTMVSDAWNSSLDHGRLVLAAVAVVAVVIVTRPLWVYAFVGLRQAVPALGSGLPSWRGATVVSWAGMRGVVTLAAVLTLPEATPLRPVPVLVALVVVVATVGGQGLTLPGLMRRLDLHGPSREEEALGAAALTQRATDVGQEVLTELESTVAPEVAQRVRETSLRKAELMWERLGPSDHDVATPSWQYRSRLDRHGAHARRVCHVRGGGHDMGAPAEVSDVRRGRLL